MDKEETSWVTLEQMEARWAARDARDAARPWPARVLVRAWRARYAAWHGLSSPRPWNRVRFGWQRYRRGWSDRDLWNFDIYMCRVAASGLRALAETGHGYPGEGTEWDTPGKWQAYLLDLAGRLSMWNHRDSAFLSEDAYEVTSAAMEEFGKNIGYFWD
jgi:hypothetical protein